MASATRMAALLHDMGELVGKREAQIISEMVSKYRSSVPVEPQWLIGKTAELSAGRYLHDELKRKLTQETNDG